MKRTLPRKTLLAAAASVLLCCTNLLAQSPLPLFTAVTNSGATGSDYGLDLQADAAGNRYIAGTFASSITLGSFNLIPPGTTTGNFVAKQHPDGTYEWAIAFPKYAAPPTDTWKVWIATDPTGNVYTTGRFSGSLTFGDTTLVAPGTTTDYSMFITKQATDGTYEWARIIPKPATGTFTLGGGISLDAAGNAYVTGQFSGTVDFDPDPVQTSDLIATNISSMYILKLDDQGHYAWAKAILPDASDPDNAAFPNDITTDAAGNVYTIGTFRVDGAGQYVDFDPGPGLFAGVPNGPSERAHFINKLDAAGNHVWTKIVGNGVFNVLVLQAQRIIVDNDGNVYGSGWFTGNADFDPGPGTVMFDGGASPNYDAFLLKLDAGGNYVWARQIAGPSSGYIQGMQADGAGNVYLTGTFSGSIDIDPGTDAADVVTLTSPGASSVYLAKWDNAGNYVDAQLMGGASSTAQGTDLIITSAGTAVYLIGYFSGTVDFNNTDAGANPTVSSGTDMFILNLSSSSTLPITLSDFRAVAQGNTASLTWITESESLNKGFAIQRSNDSRNWETIGYVDSKAEGGNSAAKLTYQFTDQSPAAGINYYQLKQEDLNGKTSLSPVRPVNMGDGKTISVYPNPVKNTLYLRGLSGGETVSIYNVAGQLQSSQQINNAGTQPIAVQSLAKGLYYIKVVGKDNVARSFNVRVE